MIHIPGMSKGNGLIRILLILLLAMGLGAVIILLIGENPLEAYAALMRDLGMDLPEDLP